MFNQLKQFKDLRSQAKKMQNQLSDIKIENEYQGLKLTMNGNQEIINLEIDPEQLTNKKNLENNLIKIFSKTQKKVQQKMAEEMMKNGGLKNLNLPDLN